MFEKDGFQEMVLQWHDDIKGKDVELGLVAVMTKSAFGHEYALMNLGRTSSLIKREEILAQLEAHKKAYFWAREKLEKVNPDKLCVIEEDLRQQKESILRQRPTLH